MCLRRHLSSLGVWIFFAFLLYNNRATCRNPQQTPRPPDQNARGLKMKGETSQSMLDQTKRDPQKAISCNCRDFCPDPNSSELQVRWTHFVLRIFITNKIWAIITMIPMEILVHY